jgi:hypothetical protein
MLGNDIHWTQASEAVMVLRQADKGVEFLRNVSKALKWITP